MNSNDNITLSANQKRLIKAWWKKATTNSNNTTSQRRFSAMVEKGVFGIPLVDSICYAHSRISFVDQRTGKDCNGVIPIVIAKCGSFLKQEALYEEGIFRISGNVKRISILQSLFDTPEGYGLDIDWTGYTPHDAANLLSRYLNYLPEPLITLEYQNSFKNIIDVEFPSIEVKIHAFQKLIEKLPVVHQYLLLYILDLLYLFSLYSDYTRMDITSLSTAFAPAILSDPNDAMNPAGYKKSQSVLLFLIQYQEHFMMPDYRHYEPSLIDSPSMEYILYLNI
ncbi:Rho GTPase activation protein [Rhizopus microsporus ATCC 52813]|uniref:Rho GTPase activation protein n=1 Tax=Rhizopus microsporus ATCC 52813 TaxID=1340429 RepID=A0A2G4T7J7_RHIZD|nr:Rho GTPase activation protein [Rhizopus microsporus ATCC 52813]PHZ16961.1 Rho GTPase activation protein [Rhizopus microsporus ATCC 52813]